MKLAILAILFVNLGKPVDLILSEPRSFEPHDDQMLQREQEDNPYLVMWTT
jgi:hypothetical protein